MTTTTKPVAKQTDQVILEQLKAMGFSDDYVETPRRLVISVEGREKTGKSHFGLTAPGPIVYLNVDIGTEGVVGKFQDKGKQVYLYDIRIPREANANVWQALWTDFKYRVRKVYELNAGSVIWDTASEMYELARLAHFGRLTEVKPSDYAVVNNEWRDVLRIAYDSMMNTIFVHKTKAVWRVVPTSGGRSSLTKTNEFEMSGYSDMGYLVQVNLVMYREDTDNGPEFSAYIKDCRQNPYVAGQVLRGPMCNFEFLLSLVHDK